MFSTIKSFIAKREKLDTYEYKELMSASKGVYLKTVLLGALIEADRMKLLVMLQNLFDESSVCLHWFTAAPPDKVNLQDAL